MARSASERWVGGVHRWGLWVGLLAVIAIAVGGCLQLGGPSSSISGSPHGGRVSVEPPEYSANPTSAPVHEFQGQLLVLGGPAEGPYALWRYDGQVGWAQVQGSGGATAIGRDSSALLLGGPSAIEVRAIGNYMQPQPPEEQEWHVGAPGNRVASIARSPSGRIALVNVDGSDGRYVVGNADGELGPLSPQPRQPFSPLGAWLKDNRVLALSVDDRQISRLAVIDPSSKQMSLLDGVTGVRAFAVSPDGAMIAAATEDGIYLADTVAWLSGGTPAEAIHIPDGHVVWNLALSPDARRLAMLSGEVGADGTTYAGREVAYELTGGGWQRLLEVELPFAFAAGQVWLD